MEIPAHQQGKRASAAEATKDWSCDGLETLSDLTGAKHTEWFVSFLFVGISLIYL